MRKEKYIKYEIFFKYFIFDASKKYPKKIRIMLHNTLLDEIIVYKSCMQSLNVKIPNNLLSNNKETIKLDIEILGDSIKQKKSLYSIYIESLKIMKLKE